MRFPALISVLRSLCPVVIGISLGFTLSLLSVSWIDETCYLGDNEVEELSVGHNTQLNGARKPNSFPSSNDGEDFEPKIIPYKQVQQSAPKKLVRSVRTSLLSYFCEETVN